MSDTTTTPPCNELFADDLLAGETALITGGGTGIGEEIALAFADLGADVAIASRSMEHLEPVAEAIEERGQNACATTVDVRDREVVEEMTQTVIDELGDISILVNNAGANFICPAEEMSANGWRSVVGTILDGTAYCTFSVGSHMLENGGGSIISMGATNSVNGAPYHSHSGAGKAGVHNLMQSVASEWGSDGVRANTVAPGYIKTEGVTEVQDEGDAGRIDDESIIEEMAIKRPGRASDCVPITAFLASDAAAYVTGSYFAVDGGYLLDIHD
jgi:NAD(P)-dependent dehydrogenase (short-subunit alcohol dehydrogenase family)